MKFRFAEFRLARKLTQEQVASSIGISQGLYNQLESGKRRVNSDHIDQLAKFYELSPVELLEDPNNNEPPFAEFYVIFQSLTLAERRKLVASAKGIAASQSDD